MIVEAVRHSLPPDLENIVQFQHELQLQTGMAGLPKLRIIQSPTSVHRLSTIGKQLSHNHLYVKREDETSLHGYAGNKVRNLEYILADAKHRNAHKLITVAPLGSNFIAALAAHAHLIGAKVEVHHFIPQITKQITTHAKYTETTGARLKIYDQALVPRLMSIPAATAAAIGSMNESSYFVSPGGSNALGAMGHMSAFFEFLDQVQGGLAPLPDTIIVGAGTCGTMAGFLAAARMRRVKIKIIGVRCVDSIVCNRYKIALLANQVLKLCNSHLRIRPREVHLESPPGQRSKYGAYHNASEEIMSFFSDEEGIRLDSTYTSKVCLFLTDYAAQHSSEKILYWHTYSGLKF